jgi:hypothetical protein
MATVRTGDGKHQKILIEVQKSWDIIDVTRFRQYLGEQYTKKEIIDGVETIYVLGGQFPEIECPCIKAPRYPYIDMINKTIIETRSRFLDLLTHDCHVIQASRITDVRYTTNLNKLLSIFEQRYFVKAGSKVTKEYYYCPDDENITLITDILYEMGADSKERKQIEDEEEAVRILDEWYEQKIGDRDNVIKAQAKTIVEKEKTIEEKEKTIEEDRKTIAEKEKTIEEKDKENAALREKLAEMERLLRNKQVE